MKRNISSMLFIGIVMFSHNSFAVYSYSEANIKGYDWLTKELYEKYIEDWGRYLEQDPKLSSLKDNEARKDPWNWYSGIGFKLFNPEGYKKVYQFKEPEISKKKGIGKDHWAFFALPRSTKNVEKIYVYSDNDKNVCHFKNNSEKGGYNYICPPSGGLCYIAVLTKDEGDLNGHWECRAGEFSAESVYLRVVPEIFEDFKKEYWPKSEEEGGKYGNFTCDKVAVLESKAGSYGGQCVPYVRKETGIEYACCNGYAKNCYDQAKACGYKVGSTPERGAIAVFNSWNGNSYGHVGIVIGIDNGRIQLRHSNWRLDERVSENWVSTRYLKGYVYPQGEGCVGGGGMTQPDPSDPPSSGKLPDFITDKVTLGNISGNKEKYTWRVNETAYVHSWTDNIGKKDWEGKAKKIKVPFYLSKGTKEDPHSEWVRVGREEIKKDNLDVKDKPKHEKIAFNIPQWAAAGYIYPGRTYNFVVCADRPKDQDNGDGDVKEIHKSNNCSTEAVFYVDYGPARNVDVMASNLALAGGKSSLQAGEAYGLQADISNIGTQYPWNGCRTSYEIKGPGTGGAWQKVADEGSAVAQLGPNSTHVEVIDESRGLKAPSVGGDYVFRACADYEQAIPEIDESNNCTPELPVRVEEPLPPPPPQVNPRIVITNPTSSDDWRSDETDHDVRWDYFDFPEKGNVRVEYSLDGGATWLLIDDSTTNDGKKHWEDMCEYHTIDTHHAYIRVTSLEYPQATDVSDEFSIDHAKECK